jgi:hypothetical protein
LVYAALTIAVGHLESDAPLKAGKQKNAGKALQDHVHLPDRAAATDAADLISRFGIHAADEAAARADQSRDRGNVLHFCRWRQIERMILLLTAGPHGHTTH